jgi:hypothetical protein
MVGCSGNTWNHYYSSGGGLVYNNLVLQGGGGNVGIGTTNPGQKLGQWIYSRTGLLLTGNAKVSTTYMELLLLIFHRCWWWVISVDGANKFSLRNGELPDRYFDYFGRWQCRHRTTVHRKSCMFLNRYWNCIEGGASSPQLQFHKEPV